MSAFPRVLSYQNSFLGSKFVVIGGAVVRKCGVMRCFTRFCEHSQNISYIDNLPSTFNISDLQSDYAKLLTEIREGDLYFCLEERTVCVSGQEIELTAKEFDALHLLIVNRKRVLTFETIAYHVWGEEYIDVTPKAIHNLLSRLRQKLQIAPEAPEYVISVRGVGYKFDIPHTEK